MAWKKWLQLFLFIPFILTLILISQWSVYAGILSVIFFTAGYLLSNRLLLDSPSFLDFSSIILSTFLRNDPDFQQRPPSSGEISCSHDVFEGKPSKNSPNQCTICECASCSREKVCISKQPPWHGLKIPNCVNIALLEFVELTLRTYVHDWYFSQISEDQAFLVEIRYQIRYVISSLYRRVKEVDLGDFIFSKILPVASAHAESYSRIRQHFGRNATPEMLEQRVLDFMRPAGGLHRALYSRDSELAYLRNLADFLVRNLADGMRLAGEGRSGRNLNNSAEEDGTFPKEWSNNPKLFLRDLCVFALLLPIADTVADPDIVNKVLILFFDPEPMRIFEDPPSRRTEFLERLTVFSPSQAPDSLLQVKFSDMIQDQPLLYLFMSHLKTVKGPLNQLQFLLSASEWQQRFQALRLDSNGLKSNRTVVEQPENLKEHIHHLHWEAWELFRNYFHEGSPDKIDFPEDLHQEFKSAVESAPEEAVKEVEGPLLKAYRLVYVWLQFSHIIPFCQSEIFLEFLCGKRPELTAEDLAHFKSAKKTWSGKKLGYNNLMVVPTSSASPTESAFSLAKLKSKFTGVFQSSVEDGSLLMMTPSRSSSGSGINMEAGSSKNRADMEEDGDGRFDMEEAEVYPGQDTGERALLLEEDLIMLPEGLDEINAAGFISPTEQELLEELQMERDFTRWKVGIPRVEPRRDESGKTMYVYVVQVIRSDLPDSHPNRQWKVDRRYAEFYVLESKLLEFHGEAVVAPFLPSKRTFVNKGRAFVESLRPAFDGFLQRLAGNSILKRSELLYLFLTSSQEFTSSLVPDAINPWKQMKKVPAKLARERGQNLAIFLRNFETSCEGFGHCSDNPRLVKSKSGMWGSSQELRSEASAISLMSITGERGKVTETIYGSVYGNNCGLMSEEPKSAYRSFDSGFYGELNPLPSSCYDLILFLGSKVFLAAKWLFIFLVSVRILMRNTVDSLIRIYVRRKLEVALCEQRIVELIELLRDSIFYEESLIRSEAERRERAEFAFKHSEDYLLTVLPAVFIKCVGEECMKKGLRQLFDCLQNPRLNKHLSYVLLDLLLKELFPELDKI